MDTSVLAQPDIGYVGREKNGSHQYLQPHNKPLNKKKMVPTSSSHFIQLIRYPLPDEENI
jgi:hypothetical protein